MDGRIINQAIDYSVTDALIDWLASNLSLSFFIDPSKFGENSGATNSTQQPLDLKIGHMMRGRRGGQMATKTALNATNWNIDDLMSQNSTAPAQLNTFSPLVHFQIAGWTIITMEDNDKMWVNLMNGKLKKSTNETISRSTASSGKREY